MTGRTTRATGRVTRASSLRLLAVLVIGVGLAVAPAAFQMFERAPKGGDMLTAFEPYMAIEEIESFRGHLGTIGAARDAAASAGLTAVDDLPAITALDRQWEAVIADMGDMLDSMEANLSEYRGVAALPPFVAFPWFFVIPGVLLAGLAVAGLRGQLPLRTVRIGLIVLGIGLLAAPAVFQMFTRAPGGARMIADFEPMMTEQRVQSVQGYFLTIGSAEGEFRRQVLPTTDPGALPEVETFVTAWPAMSADMAPMIGTMADNIDNFQAVAALPPFGLFPWFFVLPGVLVIGLVLSDRRGRDGVTDGDQPPSTTDQPILEGASS